LRNDIKENGIQEPVIVARYNSPKIPARMVIDGDENWYHIENETGYQLVDGAHRVAIASNLGYELIPAYVVNSIWLDVPHYTNFINWREDEYEKRTNS
jgi:ParB-like chromosome segregation protein Spo0J